MSDPATRALFLAIAEPTVDHRDVLADRERERSAEDKPPSRVSRPLDLSARLDALEELSRRQLELLQQTNAAIAYVTAKIEPPPAVSAEGPLAEFHQRFVAYEKVAIERLLKGEEPKPFQFRPPKPDH